MDFVLLKIDSINVWNVFKNPEKLFGKNGTKLTQKNNDDPTKINKRERYKTVLEIELRIKNGKMMRVIAKVKIK